MFDYSGWAIRDLYRRMSELDACEEKIRVEKVALTREIETRRKDAGESPDRYGRNLASELGMAPKRARELAELAQGLESLPKTFDALQSGDISVDVAGQIVKFATPEEDAKLAEQASKWTPSQAEAIARQRREISEAEARRLHESRSFRWRYDRDRRHVNFHILLPTADAEALISTIEAELARADKARRKAVDRDGDSDQAGSFGGQSFGTGSAVGSAAGSGGSAAGSSGSAAGSSRSSSDRTRCGDSTLEGSPRGESGSFDQVGSRTKVREEYQKRCADALIELINAADITVAGNGPRAQVMMVVSPGELSGSSNDAIEIGRGFGSIEVARRLCCDGDLEVVITDADGRPKAIGANSRTVPPKLSRLIRARDRRCVFPGCDEDRHIQIHHIVHFSKGGPTTEDNLGALCYFHHHLVHEGGWSMTGSASRGLSIKSPYGMRYERGPLVFDLARAG